MMGSSWGAATVALLHLGSLGALPPQVPASGMRAYVVGEQPVRVLIAAQARTARLRPNAAAAVRDHSGKQLALAPAGATITVTRVASGVRVRAGRLNETSASFTLAPATPGGGLFVSPEGGWGRRAFYPGKILIAGGPTGLRLIETVDLDSYVAGVVAAEMPRHFPLEALKAQAIAARSYALYHLGAHAADGADLCGRVHCQAYAGQAAADSSAARAVRETAGQVLVYNDLVIDAMYHAACGGSTAAAWKVREGKLLPYLSGADDWDGDTSYCSHDHDVTWIRRYSRAQAERLVRANLPKVLNDDAVKPGELHELVAISDAGTGRAERLIVRTTNGDYHVWGDSIRWLFGDGRPGAQGLRSTRFDLAVATQADGREGMYTFRGRGHGHGVGLCQWGARGRALAGQRAEEILAAYYPGTRLTDLRR